MTKKSVKIIKLINPNIKVGDTISLYDGSTLIAEGYDKDIYIINSYPDLTDSYFKLKELPMVVIEIGCENYCKGIESFENCQVYQQDIRVQFGHIIFRTASKLVHKY